MCIKIWIIYQLINQLLLLFVYEMSSLSFTPKCLINLFNVFVFLCGVSLSNTEIRNFIHQ